MAILFSTALQEEMVNWQRTVLVEKVIARWFIIIIIINIIIAPILIAGHEEYNNM